MKIQIFKGKEIQSELEADDTYYAKIVEGLDKALTDLCIKAETITEKDVPIYLLQRYSVQDAIRKYIENDIGRRISVIRATSQSLTKDLLKIREDWLTEQGLNDVFIKYCGFSLIKKTVGNTIYNEIANIFYICDEFSFDEKHSSNRSNKNDNEGWYMP